MGQSYSSKPEPLHMSLDDYIARNRQYIKEVPRRPLRTRGMDGLLLKNSRGPERLRMKHRSNLDLLDLRKLVHQLKDRSVESILPRGGLLKRGGILGRTRNCGIVPTPGKRIVQELPSQRQKSVARYQGINDRLIRKLKSSLMLDEESETDEAKLFISNLSEEATNRDVMDLFEEFGNLKSSTVHYSQIGQPLGTADVIFGCKDDAIDAMKEYDGVPLDGKPMNIELMSSAEELGMRKTVNKRQGWKERRDDWRRRQ